MATLESELKKQASCAPKNVNLILDPIAIPSYWVSREKGDATVLTKEIGLSDTDLCLIHYLFYQLITTCRNTHYKENEGLDATFTTFVVNLLTALRELSTATSTMKKAGFVSALRNVTESMLLTNTDVVSDSSYKAKRIKTVIFEELNKALSNDTTITK